MLNLEFIKKRGEDSWEEHCREIPALKSCMSKEAWMMVYSNAYHQALEDVAKDLGIPIKTA
jgi:hypothetical protein